MKAIQVKYLGATNTRGSRWKAMAEGVKSVTKAYNYRVDAEENAFQCATDLMEKYGWDGQLVSGRLPNGDYVFCFKNQ